jgi:undecaprenyl-diphosphatase
MSWFDALILGLVEGLTEFLPVSSTGHLIIAESLLGLGHEHEDPVTNAFTIIIQGAAILAVCWEYRVKLWDTTRAVFTQTSARRFAANLIIAFLPLAILAKLFGDDIKARLFAPVPVAIALVVGGLIILWAEKRTHIERIATVDEVKPADALKVGLFQVLALFPGTSRSAATILGGLFVGFNRRAATEFSFFIAIPTLLAATVYSLWEARHDLTTAYLGPLTLSSVVAFITALISIRFLLRFVSNHSFAAFAWYRIVFGGVILATWALGWVKW